VSSHHRVVIIGSGFSGIGAAIRLSQEGFDDWVVLERAADLGGVWRDNRYPGCACDVESRLFELSFAPNPRWTRRYSSQEEIWRYLADCADRFGVRQRIRFGHDVQEAAWDGDAQVWRIRTSRGDFSADVLFAAPGSLSEPRTPEIPGLEGFEGDVFHSARWPDDARLAGRRVAVVGTGASAIQIVPSIQPEVERLVVFQRTPAWVIPRHDRPVSDRMADLLERVPLLQRALRAAVYLRHEVLGLPFRHPRLAAGVERLVRRHLRHQVPDAELRERLTPDYRVGCKRILLSDDYYPALTSDNVTLVDGALVEVRPRSVVGADGAEHAVDAIILATGFHVTDFPFARRVVGREGRRLSEVWDGSPHAHLGTTVHGFPNLFVFQGPNTGLGHSSVLLMAEAQIEHALNALRHLRAADAAAVEPRADAQRAFVAEVDRRMENTVWLRGGCRSWYLDDSGRNPTLWPGGIGSFRRRVEPFDPGEYIVHARTALAPAAATTDG